MLLRSAKVRTSCIAPERMMPCPARITGRFALWINSSACLYSSGVGDRSGRYPGNCGLTGFPSNSQVDCCASLVMSTSTGPGRPELAT